MNDRTALPLPPSLEAKLADFRRRVWIIKLLEGVLAAVFGLALSYAFVFILDRFFDTPGWLRGLILVAGAAVLGLGLPLKYHRWVWQQRRLEDAARLLRQKMPRLGDQLLGIVELARMDANTGRSERLVQAAMAQAAEAVKDVPFEEAVPEDKHRRWAFAAGSVVAVAVLAFLVVPAAAWNAMARWMTPWRDVERYTFAKVEQLPKRLVVPYAEPVNLKATLAKDTEWSPKSGAIKIEQQPTVNADLKTNGYDFNLPPQKKDAPMDLKVGDVRKTIELAPTPRPELKTLLAHLILPDYLQYTTQPTIEARSGSLSLLKGAKASFELTARRNLSAATMDGATQPIEKGHVLTTSVPVTENTQHVFTWTDADGLAARDPLTLKIQAVQDEAPRVLARRDSQEQVILETEVVAVDLEVSDDFGVKRAGLEWKSLDGGEAGVAAAKGESVSGAGAPEKKELSVRATFSAKRDGVEPQSLEIKGWAEDYLPGRARSYSPGFVIHIMNKDDHAVWMTEQFGKWLQASRETYEHEQRLHETNRELRNMTPEELDRPENRRKVAQQASAEGANGDRLNRLNDSGRKLIEQAARNDAFSAKRLESWAQMLKTLKDIADKRMPSVADLLKQSAAAKGGEPGQMAQAGRPGEQKPGDPQQAQAGQPAKPGDAKPGDPTKPSDAKAGEPSKGSDSANKPTAPQVSQGESPTGGPPKPQDPNAKAPPPAPTLADNEKSHFKKPEDQPQDPNAKPAPPSGSKLDLPKTTLASPPSPNKPKKPGEKDDGPATPAQAKLDGALDEQKKLLEAFAKVTDELRSLLASMEGSTFVKRLKMASKKQMGIASDLNTGTVQAFGLDKRKVAEQITSKSKEIGDREAEQSAVVRVIQSDLEAYYQRKQDPRFKKLLDQMNKTEVVTALAHIGDDVKTNLSGRGIHASEFWADTLDRWAEEMVAAAEAGEGKPDSKPQDSLPPEIVLKVMQALHDEMALRDETREAENGKPAMDKKAYFKRAMDLAAKQDDIGRRTAEAGNAIQKLPNAKSFNKELKLLSQVIPVMGDAYKFLDQQNTGGPAVAAETEAIELLLETRRQPPGGGGGGGGNSPGGGGGGMATAAALAGIGPGADATAHIKERETGQSTGKAGREFPDEFKTGLDAYFNALEKGGSK